MPGIKATRIDGGDDFLWIDTGRDRLLHAKRKVSQKAPAVLALILRQVSAGFIKSDRAKIAVAASEQKRGSGIQGRWVVVTVMSMKWECRRGAASEARRSVLCAEN